MALCFLFSALIVALDQFFKQWIVRTIEINQFGPDIIPGVLGLMHYENDGAMLNILSGQQWLLAGIAFVAAVALVMILLRYDEGFWGTLSLASILGGTVGNLCDRIFNDGRVIDMFRTLFIRFPIFNIADVFITLGFITFLIHFISLTIKAGNNKVPENTRRIGIAREEARDLAEDPVSISEISNILPGYEQHEDPAPVTEQEIYTEAEPVYYEEPAPDVYTQVPAASDSPVEYIGEPDYLQTYQPEITYDPVTDTTPEISDIADDYDLGIDLEDLDYDVDDLLREYGLDDDDINV